MATKTICFANNKGGSGKSTTCANVGYALSTLGKKVLLIDGDMQMNLTLSFFNDEISLEYAKGEKNLYRGVVAQRDLTDFVVSTEYKGLDIIPSKKAKPAPLPEPAEPEEHPMLEALRSVDPNAMTPMDALRLLSDWKTLWGQKK